MATRKPGRPPGTPNPRAGRKLKGASRRLTKTVMLAPDILALVEGHAKARGCSLSDSVNALLHEALRNHEIDNDSGEVY